MRGVAKSEFTGRKPEGLSGRKMWNPGSEAAAWAGGSHGAGSETVSYDLSWFLASGVRSYLGGPNIFASGVVGGEKKTREAEE